MWASSFGGRTAGAPYGTDGMDSKILQVPIDKNKFKGLIHEAMDPMGLWSWDAQQLILCTAAQESLFGVLGRRQIHGPARGLFGCELPTFRWLRAKYMTRWPHLTAFCFPDLESRDDVAVIFCRLRYLVIPEPLPDGHDVKAMAAYWKRYYNTPAGKGTEDEFIEHALHYVIEV